MEAVEDGIPPNTPFNDFRPLYMATLWADRTIWGLSPAFFHGTNVLLIAATAALVVAVVRRYTRDPGLALGAGLIFAIHPFHVENAAWIGARSDPLFSVTYLLAMLSYDRWRDRKRGLPVGALLLYEASLLSKETAISFPLAVILAGWLHPERRSGAPEWRRGYLPMFVVSAAHFLVLRTWHLGGWGRTLLEGFGGGWLKHGLGFAAAGIIPLDVEFLRYSPVRWGALTVAVTVTLLTLARMRTGRIPPAALAGPAFFVLLISPYLVGFQERYIFLPTAAAAVFLAALIRAMRGRMAGTLAVVLAAGWLGGVCTQWLGWRQAAIASRNLVSALSRVADSGKVDEIVVANMPFRVAGGSVAGDFRAALALLGRRPLKVTALAYVSYPDSAADALDGPRDVAVSRSPTDAQIRLRVPEGPYWGLVGPRPAEGTERALGDDGSLRAERGGAVRVRIPFVPERRRAICVWAAGRLACLE